MEAAGKTRSLLRALAGPRPQERPGCPPASSPKTEARVLVINTGGTIGMVEDVKGEWPAAGVSGVAAGSGPGRGAAAGAAWARRDPGDPARFAVRHRCCERLPLIPGSRQLAQPVAQLMGILVSVTAAAAAAFGRGQRVSCSARLFCRASRAENETNAIALGMPAVLSHKCATVTRHPESVCLAFLLGRAWAGGRDRDFPVVTWQEQRMQGWQLPGVRMSEIGCSASHLPWDRFLLLSHQLLPSFMKPLKSAALPYLTGGGGGFDEKTRYAKLSPSKGKMFASKTEH